MGTGVRSEAALDCSARGVRARFSVRGQTSCGVTEKSPCQYPTYNVIGIILMTPLELSGSRGCWSRRREIAPNPFRAGCLHEASCAKIPEAVAMGVGG